MGEILENRGADVIYTRTEDVYQTPFQKAQIANSDGADFFVSLHRNSSPVPNQYSGVETLVFDKAGQKLEMAENIGEGTEEAGFKDLGVKERPGLVVLRRTKMPAVLVEAGFINNDQDNRLFDERFEDLAQGIADGILETLDQTEAEEQKYYRVQTGAFTDVYKRQGQYNISKPQEIGNNKIFAKRNDIIQRRVYHVVVADHRTFQQSKTDHIKDSVQRNQKSVSIFLEEEFQEITPFHYYVISNNA